MLALLCGSFQQDSRVVEDLVGNANETKMRVCPWTFLVDGEERSILGVVKPWR